MDRGKLQIRSLEGLTDLECAEAVAQSFAEVSQEYERLDRTRLPAYLPAERPLEVNVFQVKNKIENIGKTKSTLPVDISDRLRQDCALDLAEPMCDIINSCLRAGCFPKPWRREWVTPVPKPKNGEELKTCNDVRKVASTSDYSKVFEGFLRDWITQDIGDKMDINQFAGKKGVGTEHLIVALMDRVLSLLDKPGMRAVIATAVDWASAFSRTDPTLTITKFVKMGVRSSLINILIEFIDERKMSVKFNSAESKLYTLIGGGPQGSWTGQATYLVSSDDSADCVDLDDRYKFCDDLTILELVMLGSVLAEYDFIQHIPSDIQGEQRFIPVERLDTQSNLDKISRWTNDNLMRLNESKTTYLVFTRAREQFSTRLTLNQKVIERQSAVKLLGVWLQEDGGWSKNTREMCKKAYARMSMLTKLKYGGADIEELIHMFKQFVRGSLEYCSVAWGSSLTAQQSYSLERCQATALKLILQESYVSYSAALEMAGLQTLEARRLNRYLDFSLKSIKHSQNNRFLPKNPNLESNLEVRNREIFEVKQSAIPFCQRLLNEHFRLLGEDREEEGEEEGEGEGGGEGGGREEEEGGRAEGGAP